MQKKENQTPQTRERGVMRYYLRYGWMILIAFAFLSVEAICELQLPEYMANMVKEGIALSNLQKIWYWGGWMLGFTIVATVCSITVGYFASRAAASIARDMRLDCFRRVMQFSQREYNQFEVSSLITRSTNDINQLQIFTVMFVRMVMFAPIMGIGGIVKASRIAADGMQDLTWIIVGALAVIVALVLVLLFVVQPKFIRMQKQIDDLNRVAGEELEGMMVIRAFNTQQFEEKRFDNANVALTRTGLFTNRAMALLMPVMTLIMNAISLAVVWIAAYQAENVNQVANMMAFVQYAIHIVMSFMFISMIFVLLPRAAVSARRINEILHTEVTISSPEDAKEPNGERVVGDVEFCDVAYSYGGDADAISGISFVARHGETTAIIGSTGSGKSTIVSLIPRLSDVTRGSVRIDGKDVREYNLTDLRNNIGFVPQRNVLFSGTIRSNIEYGLDSLQAANAETQPISTEDAAQIAQASEFIHDKQDGMDSAIAQGGTNVSGGQKQRLAIARAIAKNAPIYIFDDSFSALDFRTDAALRAEIREKLADATVILVAQRVGTIRNADQIIVLDDGKIVGKGTHSELMRSCEVYRAIARSQMSEEELAE